MIYSKGYSLVELLVAVALSIIVLIALFFVYESSIRTFTAVNSANSAIGQAELMDSALEKYFDRWAVGVPTTGSACNISFPSSPNTILQGGSSYTLFGSMGGIGMVVNSSGSSASVISCRLENSNDSNSGYYYYIFRGGQPLTCGSQNPGIFSISLSNDNAFCDPSTLTSNSYNTTATAYCLGSTSPINLNPGDLIIRAPKEIVFTIAPNPSDNNRTWLYVTTTDLGNCNTSQNPLVPVSSFNIIQNNWTATINATVLSLEKNSQGNYSSYTVTEVFGR